MPNGSYTLKQIRVSFTLASGQFGADLGNTKIISGLRVVCQVKKSGNPSKNECRLQIFGMLDSDMKQLATLGFMNPKAAPGQTPIVARNNLILVEAGDSDGLSTVFKGEITGAWVNYQRPPDLFFEVHAVAGYYPAIAPANPTSLKGAVNATTIFQNLAQQMGLQYEDNGLTAVITNPYLPGTAYDQAAFLAKAVQCEFGIDDGTLFVAPLNIPRQSQAAAYTSPSTGMTNYPIFNKKGLEVEMIYNPQVQLGGLLQIAESQVQQANGVWRVTGLEHHLISRNHTHANWSTKVYAALGASA